MKKNTAMVNGHTVKFFRNGIKIDGSKLIRGWFSPAAEWTNRCTGEVIREHVTFFERDYRCAGPSLLVAFEHAQNNSESMTDYFEQTHANIYCDEPLYAMALAIAKEDAEYRAARKAAQMAKWLAKRNVAA